MDKDFFMYCEEVDWCLRIKSAGWDIFCVPRALVVHLGGRSTRQFRDRMFVALWRSRYRLFQKHYHPLFTMLARRIVRAGMRRGITTLRRALDRGEVSSDEAEARIGAYRQVLEM
jgi:GT2 family glycosyltransferase